MGEYPAVNRALARIVAAASGGRGSSPGGRAPEARVGPGPRRFYRRRALARAIRTARRMAAIIEAGLAFPFPAMS